MTEKARPTAEELARRVEALEEALDPKLGAFKHELASLREDLRGLDAGAGVHDAPTRPPGRPVAQGTSQRQDSSPRRTVSEELALSGKKKDPRADD